MKIKKISLFILSTFISVQSIFPIYSMTEIDALPTVGQVFSGFRTLERGVIPQLNANTVYFEHETSGANLLYIQNDDPNLSFDLAYRTIYEDESDTNHVFEHAVLAGSSKYPSNNIFFQMVSKSYYTYLNASTSLSVTQYPISSYSEEQLIKLMDVYLSCLTDPNILRDENIFKREAIRYQLEDASSPITLSGTVFNEDYGYLTDLTSNALNHIVDTLYPEEIASNQIGLAPVNYDQLTYEKVKAAYGKYYNFNNSLIILYGAMDYKKVMAFLDESYLSTEPSRGKEAVLPPPDASLTGFRETELPVAAYADDVGRESSMLSYAFDLSDFSTEDQMRLIIFCRLMNNNQSLLAEYLSKNGLGTQFMFEVDSNNVWPYAALLLPNQPPEKKELLKDTMDQFLKDTAENGISDADLEAAAVQAQIGSYLESENTTANIDASSIIANDWAHRNRVDYFERYAIALDELTGDNANEYLQHCAAMLLENDHTALIASIPQPGLAEEIKQKQDDALSKKKASMTEQEINEMIFQTKEYETWANTTPPANHDFIISASELPDFSYETQTLFDTSNGFQLGLSDTNVKEVGYFMVNFDTSGIAQEDLYYLNLFAILVGEFHMKGYSVEEISSFLDTHMMNFSISPSSIEQRPVLSCSWLDFTSSAQEDFEFLLRLLIDTDFHDREKIRSILASLVENSQISAPDQSFQKAFSYALSGTDSSVQYASYLNGSGFYQFVEEEAERLKQEEYLESFCQKMDQISKEFSNKNNLQVLISADQRSWSDLKEAAETVFGPLPLAERSFSASYRFSAIPNSTAIVSDASMQTNLFCGDLSATDFTGSDLPFFIATGDLWLIPQLRYNGGAYSAGVSFQPAYDSLLLYSYSDQYIKKTKDTFAALPDALSRATIAEEDLNGYILKAYALFTPTAGDLSKSMEALFCQANEIDLSYHQTLLDEMRKTTVSDQSHAVSVLEELIQQGYFVTVGNASAIEKDQEVFDQILYKTPL